MEKEEIVKNWLLKAEKDVETAKDLYRSTAEYTTKWVKICEKIYQSIKKNI